MINYVGEVIHDQIYLIQCFSCQEYGHKKESDLCKNQSGSDICLYCSEKHTSKQCPVKKDSNKWKCANCFKSKNLSHSLNSNGHTSTSNVCPIVIHERKNCNKSYRRLECKKLLSLNYWSFNLLSLNVRFIRNK